MAKKYIFEREFVLTIHGPLLVNSLNSLSHSSPYNFTFAFENDFSKPSVKKSIREVIKATEECALNSSAELFL